MKQAVQGTTPAGAYSPGVIAEGRFVFVAGQASLSDGEVVSGTVEEETRRAIANLRAVLAEAGADLEHVVRVGVYLADIGDFASMNAVYAEHFPTPLPARTTIGAELPGIKVEIDCVAVLPENGG